MEFLAKLKSFINNTDTKTTNVYIILVEQKNKSIVYEVYPTLDSAEIKYASKLNEVSENISKNKGTITNCTISLLQLNFRYRKMAQQLYKSANHELRKDTDNKAELLVYNLMQNIFNNCVTKIKYQQLI